MGPKKTFPLISNCKTLEKQQTLAPHSSTNTRVFSSWWKSKEIKFRFRITSSGDCGSRSETQSSNSGWSFARIYASLWDISGRAHLRSAERRDMLVPRTRTELGRRRFPVAAPTVYGTLFRHTCARHLLVADSLEIG